MALEDGSQADLTNLRMNRDELASELTVAVVPIARELRYYAEMAEGVRSRAAEMGAKVIVDGPPGDGDDRVHAEMVARIATRADVDAIILSLRNAEAAASAIQQAVANGILVIVANADFLSFPTPVHAVVGHHQIQANETMGSYASSLLTDNGRIAIVGGAPGYHSQRAIEGFVSGLDDSHAGQISLTTSGESSIEGGRKAGEEILALSPNVDLVWAANDSMIIGVAEVLRAAGLEDKILLGGDGDPTAIDLISQGILTATIDTNPRGIGRTAMDIVFAAYHGDFQGGYVSTKTEVIDARSPQ